MISYIYEQLKKNHKIVERDLGEYGFIKKSGMKFWIHSYDVEGLGNFSTIEMTAMLGLMKMESGIITPLNKDAPLFNCDIVNAMGNETLFLELYNTNLGTFDVTELDKIKQKGSNLPDYQPGEHWYDYLRLSPSVAKKAKKMSAEFETFGKEYFDCYLESAERSSDCSDKIEEKRGKVAEYADGLISNGGPATDQFVKMIGKEKTEMLFGKYIFASKKA